MSGIVWENPPELEKRKRTGRYESVLREVMQRPNTWARFASFKGTEQRQAANVAHGLNKGQLRKPEGRWEFTSRKTEDGYGVYARYLGENDRQGEETA